MRPPLFRLPLALEPYRNRYPDRPHLEFHQTAVAPPLIEQTYREHDRTRKNRLPALNPNPPLAVVSSDASVTLLLPASVLPDPIVPSSRTPVPISAHVYYLSAGILNY